MKYRFVKIKLTCFAAVLLCIVLCVGCNGSDTIGDNLSSSEKSAVETVSQTEIADAHAEDAPSLDSSPAAGKDKPKSNLPAVSSEQSGSRASDAQTSQTVEPTGQSQTAPAEDDGQSPAPSDPYEGGGY